MPYPRYEEKCNVELAHCKTGFIANSPNLLERSDKFAFRDAIAASGVSMRA